jgi:hypothetical protein
LYLTFSNGETVNVEGAKLIFKGIDDKNIIFPNEKQVTETKSEPEPKFTLIQYGTSYTMTLSDIQEVTVFQLIAVNITKTGGENESEIKGQNETENETKTVTEYDSYTVSNPSLICVNCNFCLDENSANIFLTRVDFDKEEPEDKKKLFRQYISLPIKTNYLDFAQFNETSKNNAIYGVSTDGVKATFDNCDIQTHGGEDKFFDCNLAKNKQFKGEGGKDDDHAREFIIYFNATHDNFTIPTKYELHLVKGEYLFISFTLLCLFLGILF